MLQSSHLPRQQVHLSGHHREEPAESAAGAPQPGNECCSLPRAQPCTRASSVCVGYCLGCACCVAVQPVLQQAHTAAACVHVCPQRPDPATTAGM